MKRLLALLLPCLLVVALSGCECCRWMYGSAASPVAGPTCPVPATTYSPMAPTVGTPGCNSYGPQLYPAPQTYTPAPQTYAPAPVQ